MSQTAAEAVGRLARKLSAEAATAQQEAARAQALGWFLEVAYLNGRAEGLRQGSVLAAQRSEDLMRRGW